MKKFFFYKKVKNRRFQTRRFQKIEKNILQKNFLLSILGLDLTYI